MTTTFVFIDIIVRSPAADELGFWISGPTNTLDRGQSWRAIAPSGVAHCYLGNQAQLVKVGDTFLADHFISVFDERRLRRIRQNPVVLAAALPQNAIADVCKSPIRFLTSAPAHFDVLRGTMIRCETSSEMSELPSSMNEIDKHPELYIDIPFAVQIISEKVAFGGVVTPTSETDAVLVLIDPPTGVTPTKLEIYLDNERLGVFQCD